MQPSNTRATSVAVAGLVREVFLELALLVPILVGVSGRLLLRSDVRPFLRIRPIEFQPLLEARLGIWLDCLDGALRLAHAAVDAFIGMDDEHVLALVEAIDWADLNAIRKLAFDATVIDDEGHGRDGPGRS